MQELPTSTKRALSAGRQGLKAIGLLLLFSFFFTARMASVHRALNVLHGM